MTFRLQFLFWIHFIIIHHYHQTFIDHTMIHFSWSASLCGLKRVFHGSQWQKTQLTGQGSQKTEWSGGSSTAMFNSFFWSACPISRIRPVAVHLFTLLAQDLSCLIKHRDKWRMSGRVICARSSLPQHTANPTQKLRNWVQGFLFPVSFIPL